MTVPPGFSIALTDGPLDDPVTWTRIDNHSGVLVESVAIDRGRGDERSKTAPGKVTITGKDTVGDLDPSNSSSPFYGNLVPVKPAAYTLFNPTDSSWNWLFRGHIDTIKLTLGPAEKWLEFEITLVGMLDIANDAEVIPAQAGVVPAPTESDGDCFYIGQPVNDRLNAVLSDVGTAFVGQAWPSELLQIASGNVNVQERVYPRGTSLLQAIDEACDAEFPGATNRFETVDGKFAFRGRFYRFVPSAYIPSDNRTRTSGTEMLQWFVGDTNAYESDDTIAAYTGLVFQVGKTNLINTCDVTPKGITELELASGTQFFSDPTSIDAYGPRTSGMSLENLITGSSDAESNDALEETATFADATVQNYKDPVTFVSELTFRNPPPGDSTLSANVWRLLCGIELSDLVTVTSHHPGGGGFKSGGTVNQDHYVESIKYDLVPLRGDEIDVTLTVGLSSRQHFTYMPGSWDPPSP